MRKIFSTALFGLFVIATACHARDSESVIRSAIDAGPVQVLSVPEGSIKLVFASGRLALAKTTISDWLKNDASAVSGYFGRFPVPQLGMLLVPVAGNQISQGVTFGDGMPVIRIGIGDAADADVLKKDWVVVHEMVHLAFPLMPRQHHWLEEGIATYVEPIARAQSGQLSAEKVWGDMVRDLYQGLPQEGDRGLDNTHTWGRTYWGGALFCLLADLRLREQTNNRYGLQHALRAINRESGGMAHERSIEQALATGDASTGTHVLINLYQEMANKPVSPDLALLWQKLGIGVIDGKIVFDNSAPEAKIRLAILTPLPANEHLALP